MLGDTTISDNRASAYREGDISIYRASAIGSCTKALVAAMLGYKEDRPAFTHNILTNAAKEGNLHEDAIVAELQDTYGWRVWASQDIVEEQVIVIRGRESLQLQIRPVNDHLS